MCSLANIIRVEHVARMEEVKNMYKTLVGKTETNINCMRDLGEKWKGNIKMDV
jgi:hypothetical protein